MFSLRITELEAEEDLPPIEFRVETFEASLVEKEQRSLCFDLENRPLAYWYDGQTTSEITAFGWKRDDDDFVHTMILRPPVFGYDEPSFWYQGHRGAGAQFSVRTAYEWFKNELETVDLVYGHNIRKHDLPMFQAGLLRLELPILPPLKTSDTCLDYPKRGGMSRSLENLASYYDLEGEKFTMTQRMWEDANRLTQSGMDLARRRVVSDVLLQERLFHKLNELEILGPSKTWRPR